MINLKKLELLLDLKVPDVNDDREVWEEYRKKLDECISQLNMVKHEVDEILQYL